MSWQLEALASALLLANVWLVARRSLWNYAFGIFAVALYAIIFWRAHLFAAFALQGLFLGLNIYGVLNWRRSASEGGVVPVQRMSRTERWVTLAGTAILALMAGLLLHRTTDAAVPFADSANTALALAAQFWQARRRVETWALWSLVNLLSVGLYASQALWFTSAVYAVLLGVAIYGWCEWRRAERGIA